MFTPFRLINQLTNSLIHYLHPPACGELCRTIEDLSRTKQVNAVFWCGGFLPRIHRNDAAHGWPGHSGLYTLHKPGQSPSNLFLCLWTKLSIFSLQLYELAILIQYFLWRQVRVWVLYGRWRWTFECRNGRAVSLVVPKAKRTKYTYNFMKGKKIWKNYVF